MSTLIITRGLPASGKSTWAKSWVAEDPERRARMNRDCLRCTLFGAGKSVLPNGQEELVTLAQHAAVRQLLDRGIDVVADDMNLRPKYVRAWREFAEGEGHEFETIEFGTAVETCVTRDWIRGQHRQEVVGCDVIRELARKYMPKGEFLPETKPAEPVAGGKYVPNLLKPKAFIVDIDGTVALNTSGRGWYDLDRVIEDAENTPVANIVHGLATYHKKVAYGLVGTPIYCSGRDEGAREATEQWLKRHALPDGPLFMRPAGDMRQDYIIKRELFDKHIRDSYNVQFVLDDRNQVVRMWRSLGLTCLQVADGNF